MLYKVLRSLVGGVFKIIYRLDVDKTYDLDNNKKLIICSNHISNLDPIILSIVFKQQIYWMGKRELFDFKPLGWFLSKLGVFPVDRENTGLSTLRTSMKILKEGHSLGVFPEGTRVTSMDLKNAKPGVILISSKAKAPILPVYIEASYRPFSQVKIRIGEELTFFESQEKLSKEDYKDLSEEVLRKIYDLKN